MNCVYMEVTKDKYELPVAIADTISELSQITGASNNTISSTISHGKYNKDKYKHSKFIKVVFED